MRKRSLAYWQRHREAINERRRARRAANPELTRARKLATRRKSLYGLTVERVEAMLASQGGKCAVCRSDITVNAPYQKTVRTRVCVDHDHVTGATRGLLCPACNQVLGIMKDDSALLRAAADYLERFASS